MIFAYLVKIGSIKVVNDFLSKKEDLAIIEEQKKKDAEGKTALMHAVISNNLAVVKLLCQKGRIDIAAFNAQDNNGMTAVMYAAKLGRGDILKFFYNIPYKLIDDIGEQNFSYTAEDYLQGHNALMLAVMCGHYNCFPYLYSKEIQHIINHQNKDGKTLIMLAFEYVRFGNIAGSKEEIIDSKQFLNELLQVIKIVFRGRNEKYLNVQFNNKIDLTIQDKDKRNIFAYAKEAECERELLSFISSIPINAIISDLSIYKLSGDEQKSVKCSERDLTDWIIFDSAPSITIESDGESCASLQSSTIPLESSEESNVDLQEMIPERVSSGLFLR